MKTRMLAVLALLVGAWGCGDNDNSGPATTAPSAALQCEVMGSLCHDSETDAGQACHELGHDGVPAECANQFRGCITECLGNEDGDPFCRALGSLCHHTASDEGQACHELGHDDDPGACRDRFDACATLCLAESE